MTVAVAVAVVEVIDSGEEESGVLREGPAIDEDDVPTRGRCGGPPKDDDAVLPAALAAVTTARALLPTLPLLPNGMEVVVVVVVAVLEDKDERVVDIAAVLCVAIVDESE